MRQFKKFIETLLSDSNRASSKRLVGILALLMFIAYGIKGLIINFNLEFWIFYVSLCSVTMWIAFRFMSSDKALKYNVLGQLAKFNMRNAVQQVIGTETELDDLMQPGIGATQSGVVERENENFPKSTVPEEDQ